MALYFAGQWCPLCRRFTPALKEFHEKYKSSMAIVFISSDGSASDAQTHYNAMARAGWYMLPFDAPLAATLKRRHGVWSGRESWSFLGSRRRSGVPCVVVIDEAGAELSFLAGERYGAAALYEWQPEAKSAWRRPDEL